MFPITDFTQTSFTLTPTDDSGAAANAVSIPISVRLGPPVVSALVNDTTPTAPPGIYDEITIWGAGFSPTGGNTVTLTGPAPMQPIYVTQASNQALGLDFWDGSATQINIQLAQLPHSEVPGTAESIT